MRNTSFSKRDGSYSSTRSSFGGISFSNYYPSSNLGGTTIRNGNITTRINNSGQITGTAVKTPGAGTLYFNSSGSIVSKLTPFK